MNTEAVGLPEWISEPVSLALADLREEDAAELALEWRAESDEAGILIVGEPVGASERFENDEDRPANVVVAVARWLQQQLYPEATVPRAEARPLCAGHDHPMDARNLYDVAWWFCPERNAPIQVIGER